MVPRDPSPAVYRVVITTLSIAVAHVDTGVHGDVKGLTVKAVTPVTAHASEVRRP